METIFLNAAGTVLFVRDDMEAGNWTQEEYSVNCTFPYVPGKVIQRGQRVAFRDPATNTLEMFEIRNVNTIEPEHYQQFTAEHVAVAELSDEHINNKEYTNIPPQTALADVLTGTLWAVGNVSVGDLTEQASIRAQIATLGLNGNVDLTSRPIIYPDVMQNVGYTDFIGDYATLYSMTYTKTAKNNTAVTLLMTPIQQNGTVLSQDSLDAYVDELCIDNNDLAGFKSADTKGLLMHFLAGTQISAMDAIAESAHDLSDDWETCVAGVASSADISRGSVWQAVNAVASNWNVYITPRVTFSTTGAVTGRYLDITTAQGTWRGVRLSVDKNLNDSSVIIDDSEVLTALYGYGGNIEKSQASGDDKSEELTFKDIVWTATADHPAKPANQTYLEDPAKTALYGRNGRPRYGFYQNGDIKDAEVLLQKTWESLKQTSEPKINITGTVTDLYRLGYKDQPLRLHDTVIVEIRQTGELYNLEIIKLDVDLIDPTATRPEIGSYIPNIIYINRETNDKASGGGGGGGSPRSKTELDEKIAQFESDWIYEKQRIGMVTGIKKGRVYIKAASIVASINNDGGTNVKLEADTIDINGLVTAIKTYDLECQKFTAYSDADFQGEVTFNEGADFALSDVNNITNLDAENAAFDTLEVDGQGATWLSKSISTPTYGTRRFFLYSPSSTDLSIAGAARHYPVTGHSEETIHYLGYVVST